MSASLFSSGYSVPSSVSGTLQVCIGGGSNTVTGLTVAQAAQTLTMTPQTTNYGYINPATGLVAVNTTGFVSGQIPLFIAVANSVQVTAINDVRVTYTSAGGIAATVPNFADSETPSGAINSINTVYSLAHAPNPAASLALFLNGLLQQAGGFDYTLAGSTITMNSAPQTGDTLVAYYRY